MASLSPSSRLLLASIPQLAFNARRISPELRKTIIVEGELGLGHVLSHLLISVSHLIETLGQADLHPIDLSIAELLAAVAAAKSSSALKGRVAGTKSAVLRRISQNIENRLGDRNLNIMSVAQGEGLSSRYVQKMFEASGESFTRYLLGRRLERCREYLISPDYDHLSVSEICFLWGFNDPAHFSRSFKERYGVSPVAFRHDAAQRPSKQPLFHATRGWPQELPRNKRDECITVLADRTVRSFPYEEEAGGLQHQSTQKHHVLKAQAETVHWGYFSRSLAPALEIESGDTVTIETLTQHGNDDYDRMIKGDRSAEDVFKWTSKEKTIDRRGAGPLNASVFGRGAGEGFGVQIMTGPIAIKGARPRDVLEVRIVDIFPRPSQNPEYLGRSFGSNAAAWWGFHYKELLAEPRDREAITIYEIFANAHSPHAKAICNFHWTPQTDPFGVMHSKMDYPGIPIDHDTVQKKYDFLSGAEIPLRPHFGVIGVAPREEGLVDSIPPSYFGGNLDNWRIGKGAKIFLPVAVDGALLSVGDPHAAQGDSELGGTAIECSMTGVFEVILHKRVQQDSPFLRDLTYPLIETETEWIVQGLSHPNYLTELGENAQSAIYNKSSIDLAMKDAFRKMRRFLMTGRGLSEDEAISLMSVAVDFGISQVVDGNWGVHALLPKRVFS
jgi:acetamidase/formamidase/AraC-like DNA-binding protein